MYLQPPFEADRLNIGGGLNTKDHIDSNKKYGKLSYDIGGSGKPKAMALMKYIKGGSNYAVYQFLDTEVFAWYVHVKNYKRGTVKLREEFADREGNYYLHINMVLYKADNNFIKGDHHIDWVKYLDPAVKVVTTWGGSEYTGKNNGQPLPTSKFNYDLTKMSAIIPTKYMILTPGNVRSEPRIGDNIKETIKTDGTVIEFTHAIEGENTSGSNIWYYRADRGYVHRSVLKEIPASNAEVEKLRQELVEVRAKNILDMEQAALKQKEFEYSIKELIATNSILEGSLNNAYEIAKELETKVSVQSDIIGSLNKQIEELNKPKPVQPGYLLKMLIDILKKIFNR